MMRIVPPKPFLFEAGKRAVLLLHGFTGSSADVRMLGRFLEKKDTLAMRRNIKGTGYRLKIFCIRAQATGGKMS